MNDFDDILNAFECEFPECSIRVRDNVHTGMTVVLEGPIQGGVAVGVPVPADDDLLEVVFRAARDEAIKEGLKLAHNSHVH